MPNVSLVPVDGGLALLSPFDSQLVAGIKALPYADRRWDAVTRRWIIDPKHAPTVAALVAQHLGVTLSVPQVHAVSTPQVKLVALEYLGRCKDRDGQHLASGYADGGWSLQFPEGVLRSWFCDPASETEPTPTAPAGPQTLYAVLTVTQQATTDEIKQAYRRLAMQWHPDRCKEPDAQERFVHIKSAYDVLSNDRSRRKYNAGLALEAQSTTAQEHRQQSDAAFLRGLLRRTDEFGYRAPLRCGLILAEGTPRVGQFLVSKILRWEDIQNSQGQTLVTSWPLGAQMFIREWV